ncbi:MAG: PPOX class F420-dependent oxidoreductase [Deltaproteobacteria bacterium]|nr:PPOX class F420-dependent oxidoreductase [Deltaproteobacteria bacterium]
MTAGNVLDSARYLSLGTFRKSGVRVDTPVWFAEKEGKLYIFSAGNAGKVKRLRNSDRAQVAACTATGKLTGEWSQARARIVEDAHLAEQAHAALVSKYGWQMRILDFFSRLSGKMKQRAFLEAILDVATEVDTIIEVQPLSNKEPNQASAIE